MIVPVMAISNLVLTQQIYSEETNGAHAHYREPVPLSNDPGFWFQKMCKRTQNDHGNFQRRFTVTSKNARLKEVLSDYQKWRFQFQILQIRTCTIVTQNVDGKFHRHFQAMADENATMEISS